MIANVLAKAGETRGSRTALLSEKILKLHGHPEYFGIYYSL